MFLKLAIAATATIEAASSSSSGTRRLRTLHNNHDETSSSSSTRRLRTVNHEEYASAELGGGKYFPPFHKTAIYKLIVVTRIIDFSPSFTLVWFYFFY